MKATRSFLTISSQGFKALTGCQIGGTIREDTLVLELLISGSRNRRMFIF